jgi:hypothetical protein
MTCVEICPEQYYTGKSLNWIRDIIILFRLDHHLRKCIRCKPDCASCDTSSDICTSCPDGYALKNSDCIKASKECDSNGYFDFITNE